MLYPTFALKKKKGITINGIKRYVLYFLFYFTLIAINSTKYNFFFM